MIVIDTLARNFGAGNENSTEDMNRFVASIDRYLREEFGSAILLVHHTGHAIHARQTIGHGGQPAIGAERQRLPSRPSPPQPQRGPKQEPTRSLRRLLPTPRSSRPSRTRLQREPLLRHLHSRCLARSC